MNFPSTLMEYHDREEFIDALYKMLCWVLSGTDYLKRPVNDRAVVTIGSTGNSPMRES